MVTEKPCNISEQPIELSQEKGSGTSWTSSEEYLPKQYLRKDLRWPPFDNEPRVQEKQQVKDQQPCISNFVVCLTIPTSN